MSTKTDKLLSVLKLQPVVPVLVIDNLATAVPLARALVAGGLKAIEITLRTPAALDAIRAVAKANIIGADLNELAPMLDASGVSTATACKVLRELLIALDKGWPGFQV